MKTGPFRPFLRRTAALAGVALVGAAAALVLAEGALRLVRGPTPPLETVDEEFSWRYLDIRRPFFARSGDEFFSVPTRAHRLRFPAEKPAGERRVFIVGESFADLFPPETLAECFSRVFPGYRWRVLNAGMCAYDSYRILQIAEELPRYSPDLVVVLMGNNDGQHDPVRINTWPYRSRVVAASHVLRLLTGLIEPPIALRKEEVNAFFDRNLRRMTAVLRRRGVPVVLVTLPTNVDAADPGSFWTKSRVLGFAPAGKNAPLVPAGSWKESDDRRLSLERAGLMRQAARSDGGVLLADFAARLDGIAADGQAYDWFWDLFHVWPPVYRLLSDDIVEAYLRYDASLPEGAPGKLSGRRDAGFRRATPEEVLRENRRHMRAEILRDEAVDPQVYPYTVPMEFRYFDNALHILDRYWAVDPETVATLRERLALRASADPKARRAGYFRYAAAGDYLRRRGRYEAGLAHLDDAVAFLPEAWEGYLLRGVCRYAAGMRPAADRDFAAVRRMKGGFGWLTVSYLDGIHAPDRVSAGRGGGS